MVKALIKFMPIIIPFVVVPLIVYYANLKSDWNTHSMDANVRLTFSQFEKMYQVAPERYQMTNYGTIYKSSKKAFIICFGFEDYCAYRKWLKKLNQECQDAAAIEAKKEYMDCVRKDIDAFKSELEEGIQAMRDLYC